MTVLFVISGNKIGGISTIVFAQAESLIKKGIHIEYFRIQGNGFINYLKSIRLLRDTLKNTKPDITHAHYSLSGIVAALAGAKPIIVSLMGSDVFSSQFLNLINRIFSIFFWDKVIVKSEQMKIVSRIKQAEIIPNGVDRNLFYPINYQDNSEVNIEKKILFGGDPLRIEKNYKLANDAINQLTEFKIEVIFLKGIPYNKVPNLINEVDLILLTSKYEGSPNIIKEALACNKPVVSTDVGDVKELISDIEGCYIAQENDLDIASKIRKVFSNRNMINSRIKTTHLDSKLIASRIIDTYKAILHEN